MIPPHRWPRDTTPLLDPILAWGASYSRHLRYRIPTVLDYIDLFIFIHILGPVPYGTNPSSLILLCTLLSLSVGRHCFYSSRCPTVSLFIMLSVIVARLYRATANPTVPTQTLIVSNFTHRVPKRLRIRRHVIHHTRLDALRCRPSSRL